ncbi:RNA-binding protein [Acrasis kona]|uniref:RNA-binding protein n=1 Tax=Acrasis kona TaxID=1008807 RepID=A0AAW2Z0T3_9EUKA
MSTTEGSDNVWDSMVTDDTKINTITPEELNKQVQNSHVPSKVKKTKSQEDKEKPNSKSDKAHFRSVRVPANKYAALQRDWEQIYTPIVEKLELQIRMNTKRRTVELRTVPSSETADETTLQKAHDFVDAYMQGFEVQDALALLRLDDIYVESFDVKDVKRSLQGDQLSRTIARIAGKGGAVKYTIENATKTRLVVADSRIHILGSFRNIQIARNAIVDLVLGSPPGVVYNKLRVISNRMKESF